MNGPHLHLLVNHVPILGAIFGTILLAASLIWESQALRRAALLTLFVVGVAGFIANQSGEPAEHALRGIPGVTRAAIHEHEEMGEKAYLLAVVLGIAALAGVLKWRRSAVPRVATLVFMLGGLFVTGAMGYTGLLGGRIRHTEVRPGATTDDAIRVEPRRQRPPAAQPAPE